MDPETIRALAPIIGAIITGIFGILTKAIQPRQIKINWFIVAIFAIAGGWFGYLIGINISKLPFVFGGLEGPSTQSPIPNANPFPKGELVMEINFSDRRDGKCNDYDPNLLGYEDGQYYIQPEPNGYIAICHQKNRLGAEGSLQVTAFPEGDLQDPYGFAVVFGWSGNSFKTTDACIFGIRRQGTTTRAFFENRIEGKRSAYTQELKTVNLDNAPHTLRVVLHSDGNATGYLDERFFAEYQFSRCSIGPIGIMAWGPGENKIYFDDLKLFELP